jgi:hypothetical protein
VKLKLTPVVVGYVKVKLTGFANPAPVWTAPYPEDHVPDSPVRFEVRSWALTVREKSERIARTEKRTKRGGKVCLRRGEVGLDFENDRGFEGCCWEDGGFEDLIWFEGIAVWEGWDVDGSDRFEDEPDR